MVISTSTCRFIPQNYLNTFTAGKKIISDCPISFQHGWYDVEDDESNGLHAGKEDNLSYFSIWF